jgi:ABC-type sugar transport system ATPase subunit
MEPNLKLEMRDISKFFAGNAVLKKVNFQLRKGEVHSLLGANGAGKSTLVKILNGIYHADEGEIFIDGKPAHIRQSEDAQRLGISFVHQELNICPELSIAENIFVGKLEKNKFGFYDSAKTLQSAQKLIDMIQIDLDARQKVGKLRVAEKQIIEILKALTMNASILVLDEPTSSLNEHEKEIFFGIVKRLKNQGVSVIFISHFLEDILSMSDRITVIKDGVNNGVFIASEIDKNTLITSMIGNALIKHQERKKTDLMNEQIALEVQDFSSANKFDSINLKLPKGSIMGICGLLGAGKTEIARAIFGLDTIDSGTVLVNGKSIKKITPENMLKNGITLVSEDRKIDGFIPLLSIRENSTLSVFSKMTKLFGVFDRTKQSKFVEDLTKKMTVKCSSIEQMVSSLSGGNQQKVVISRCVAAKPSVFLLDEPTRGVDVYAKSEIYQILTNMANEGISVLIFSSELEELLEVCDDIVILKKGKIVDVIRAIETDKHTLLSKIS